MKSLVSTLTLLAVATIAGAEAVSFDFEGVSITDLETAGWTFQDGGTVSDTIVIETGTVKNGSAALRMGNQDWASFELGGEYGTLDLWVYDGAYYAYSGTSVYGPTWGLQKGYTADWTFPGSTTNTYDYIYGIGAGLVHKSWLDSDTGYAEEHGQTVPNVKALQDQVDGGNTDWTEQNILDAQAVLYNGWGRPSWFSPSFLGGASPNYSWERIEGWCHYQICYKEDGKVEIYLLENGDASNTASAVYDINDPELDDPQNTFDGTYGGGVDRMFIWGGRTEMVGMGINEFGDVIVDDVTWTPENTPICNPGDVNCDGTVNIYDFLTLRSNYGKTSGATWGEGDMNADGAINIYDFLILRGAYGVTY